MTAQRMRKYAAWTFAAALAAFAMVFLMGEGTVLVILGELLAILLSGLAVVLMVASLFFPHEVE